jgi:hypothetical protein
MRGSWVHNAVYDQIICVYLIRSIHTERRSINSILMNFQEFLCVLGSNKDCTACSSELIEVGNDKLMNDCCIVILVVMSYYLHLPFDLAKILSVDVLSYSPLMRRMRLGTN